MINFSPFREDEAIGYMNGNETQISITMWWSMINNVVK